MRATLVNLSPKSRRTTVAVTFPKDLADSFPVECTFLTDDKRKFRAVKSKTVGKKAVFRIKVTMNGSEKLSGELQSIPHIDSTQTYKWHKWTNDNVFGIFPQIGVSDTENLSDVTWTTGILKYQILESSPIHVKLFIQQAIPTSGLIFEYVLTINHNDPVVDLRGKIVWSDRTDPISYKSFKYLFLKCGEYVALDFATRYGCSAPIFDPTHRWIINLGKDIRFKDGSAIPVTGQILTFIGPNVGDVITSATPNMADDDSLDFESLLAALFGEVVGCSHDFDSQWLASLNIPRRSDMSVLVSEAQQKWTAFQSMIGTAANYYVNRPLGIGPTSGITGDQEDFAATKGTYVVSAHDPRHIIAYRYSIYADLFRGFMHYENYVPLILENHPRWVTWSGVTHYSSSVSPDRLGKTDTPLSTPFNGWTGYDDEHRSQNNLAAYIMLSDDWLAEDIVMHHITTDLASYRMRYLSLGGGAARAQGRTAGAWANFIPLFDGPIVNKLITLLNARWQSAKSNTKFINTKLVKVLDNHSPDYRKPIFDTNGNLLPTWSIWEHALTAIGFYNSHKVNTSTDSAFILKTLLEQITIWGCFEDTDGWWIVNDMWYNNGDPITGDLKKSNPYILYGRGGVSTWVLAALLVAGEYLPKGSDLQVKAATCARFLTMNREATTLFDAEWWAAVHSVVDQ